MVVDSIKSMQSKVPNFVECEVFTPTQLDFSNFKKFIEKLEQRNVSFAKVSSENGLIIGRIMAQTMCFYFQFLFVGYSTTGMEVAFKNRSKRLPTTMLCHAKMLEASSRRL